MSAGDKQEGVHPLQGFAGLAAQLTDVDEAIAKARISQASSNEAPKANGGGNNAHVGWVSEADPAARAGTKPYIWWAVIGIILASIWIASNMGGSQQTATSTDPSTQTPNLDEIFPPGSEATTSDEAVEVPPPPGIRSNLNLPQVRYCLAEKVRIDSARRIVDNYDGAQVDEANAMVSDYNARCGEFYYRPSEMNAAKFYVEDHRAELERDGLERITSIARERKPASAGVTSGESAAKQPAGRDGASTWFDSSGTDSETADQLDVEGGGCDENSSAEC